MTFVDFAKSQYNGTSPQTAVVDVVEGNIIVVADTAFANNTTFSVSDTASNVYTFLDKTSGSGQTSAWTAVANGDATITVSVSMTTNSSNSGFAVHVFGDVELGAHAVGNGSGAPSINLVTTGDGSTILYVGQDNNETLDPRTWRTINGITPTNGNGLETLYDDFDFWFEAFGAYWPDAGTAGSKTVGMSSPSGQNWTGIAIELAAAGSGFNPAQSSMMMAMF